MHTMRDLLRDPAWRMEDLGRPIPDSPHACIVCLPTWEAVRGYEEGRSDVMEVLQAGYPRFFLHPKVSELFASWERRPGREGERVLMFPGEAACRRARRFVEARGGTVCSIEEIDGLWALVTPAASYHAARAYWRHTGEIVSSRQAEDYAANRMTGAGDTDAVRAAMAATMGVPAEDLVLFESGMAAIFTACRIVTSLRPGRRTLQVGLPYVDALKVQEHFGAGVDFVASSGAANLPGAIEALRAGRYAGVFCEAPGNPLLNTPDLGQLAEACRESRTPLVVDDTVCSHANVDVLPLADLVSTSLTKWVSGVGDVMAGSLKLNPGSPLCGLLRERLYREAPGGSRLYPRDAKVLVRNAAGFRGRIALANRHGEQVADWLANQPAIAELRYPKLTDRGRYDQLRAAGGGFGGVLSFTLDRPSAAPGVYDALRLSKGPSLGTEYSLACPYTLLAHYDELDWAEKHGASRNLIRLSVGLEPPETVIAALDEALRLAR